ncbi:uncharacterized protein [Chelonus insularis]|uniref:uncharacterized protein n=1 Tax=Chelonus insularis TaxID=460826 RepID=UPI001588D4B8|nr:uncharacterized protein LOC118072917 [Chelonus insularis]
MSNQKFNSGYVLLRETIKEKNKKKARFLIRNNVSVNVPNTKGNTPLHWAIIKFDDVHIMTMLLAKGANINATNHHRQNPLQVAIHFNKTEAALLLIKKGALVKDNLNELLLMAIERKNKKIVEMLIHNGIEQNSFIDLKIPLNAAISHGQSKIIQQIIPHCCFSKPSDKYIPREAVTKSGSSYQACVNLLLEWNFTVNPDSKHDEDFIHAAVKKGYLPIILQLLELEIDVNLVNPKTGLNLLKVACLFKRHEIVEMLLEHNAYVNETTPTNTDVLDKLLRKNQKYSFSLVPYVKMLRNITCLHIAVLNSDPKMTELLLEYGAMIIDDPTFFNITCIAVRMNCEEIVRIFLGRVNVNDIDSEGKSLLHFCVSFQYYKEDNKFNIAKLLLEKGATTHIQKSGNSLLYEAIKNRHQKIAQLFLEYNADIQYVSPEGTSLLHKAIENDFNPKFIESLLKHDFPVDAMNGSKLTPLLFACKYHFKNLSGIVKVLLNYNANVNCTDEDMMTALHFVCQDQNLEVILALLEKGANPSAKNNEGQTALHLACKRKFFPVFSDFKIKYNNDKIASIIRLLLHHNVNIDAVDSKGWTPLFVACETYHDAAVKCLLDYHANANHTDLEKLTPLYIAVQYSVYHCRVAKILLEHKVNVHCMDKCGNSIIHIAVKSNALNLIESLARTQINFNSINKDGNTPLQIAVKEHSVDMVKKLIKYGANINILDKNKRTPLQNAIKYIFHYNYELAILFLLHWCHSSPFTDNNSEIYISNIIKYKEIVRVIKTYAIKLKVAGLKINYQNLKILSNSFNDESSDESDVYEDNFDEENLNQLDIQQLELRCEQEIEQMKMNKLGVNKMTFYDLLTKNIHFLCKFVRNKIIRQILESEVYDEKFPLYIDIVRSRFRDAKFRYRMMNSASKYFTANITKRLPDNCVDTVFSYLNIKDIKMFIRAIKYNLKKDNLNMMVNNGYVSNTRGNSPLHCAVIEFESLHVIEILLKGGANIHAKNYHNYKPLDLSIQNNNTQAALLLIRRGALAGEDLNQLLLTAMELQNVTIFKALIDHGIKFNPLIDLKIPLNVAISQGQSKVIQHILPHFQFFKPSDQYIPKEAVTRSGPQYEECVQLLLKWNFIVSPDSNNDKDFVFGSVKNGYLPIFTQLLKVGIDVNMIDSNTGINLLKIACLYKHHEIVELLLKQNASINVKTSTNIKILNQKEHYRSNYLISSIHEINNLRDITCLHIAVLNSDAKMTKLLLNYGAKIVDDPIFFNITRIAVLRNCEEIVRMFLNYGLNVNTIDRRGRTLLHRCIHFDFTRKDYRFNIVKLLLEKGAITHIQTPHNTFLFEAIKNRHHKIARLLLDYNADIQYVSRRGDTVLHKAIESQVDVEFIATLLKLNLPVNATNKNLYTPLHIACRFNFDNTPKTKEHIKLLLGYNANINCTDSHLMTPLHYACYLHKLEIVALLLENGANPNAKSEKGQTPLHIVSEQKYEFNEGIAWKRFNDKTPNIIELLLKYNADTEAVDINGWTPLILACKTGHNKAIELLLKKANVHCMDKQRNSVAHIIVDEENEEFIKNLAHTQVNLNCVNREGNTPLHIAVQKKSVKMTESLIKCGANVNIVDKRKRTPLRNAIEYMFHYQRKLDNVTNDSSFNSRDRSWDYSDYSDYEDDDNYFSDDDVEIHRSLVCKVKKYQKIITLLKTHIIKLKNAGLKVNNQNWKLVYNFNDNRTNDDSSTDEERFFNEGNVIHEDVEVINNPLIQFLRVTVKCQREIELIKMENIGVNNMTFQDLLTINIHRLSRFVKNKKIRQTLELEVYDEKFPLYIDIIRGRFRDAKFRCRMMNSAKKYFSSNITQRLSDDCIDLVFSYLNIKDLKMFIRAFKPLN